MDDLGFNKIAAAILATALGFMGLKEISHAFMHVEVPDVPAYALEIANTNEGGEAVIEVPFPSPDFIAAMDAAKGEKVFKKCLSCHNADNGGANSTGPNLWNIVGETAAQKPGFKYSSAMTNANLTWDYETLNDYLAKPTTYIKGTAMNFIGLKKEKDRAAVIEYLRVAAPSPIAHPAITEQPAEEVVEALDSPVLQGETPPVIDVPVEDDVPQEEPAAEPEE